MNAPTASTSFAHGAAARTAVLLVQLGTPAAPTASAVRTYLRQFLSDRRVVELPALLWQPILRGPVLATRPAKSAAKYATIWTPEGSPLRVHTERQATMLRGWLGERGHDIEVAHAMRYGEPSVPSVLRALRERNVRRLLVLPMYPQYAGSTTASAFDSVFAELSGWRDLPELRTVRGFHDDPSYLDALADAIRARWAHDGPPDRFVMSFHGVPERTLKAGDPYHCECQKTGRLLAGRLGLPSDRWIVTFQSRFGRARWLQPYTAPTLARLGAEGVRRVDVACPGFVADCLETLEEIAQEGRDEFLHAGGKEFRYLPCLNDAPAFIDALASLVERQASGWPTRPAGSSDEASARRAELSAQRARAMEMGAAR